MKTFFNALYKATTLQYFPFNNLQGQPRPNQRTQLVLKRRGQNQ